MGTRLTIMAAGAGTDRLEVGLGTNARNFLMATLGPNADDHDQRNKGTELYSTYTLQSRVQNASRATYTQAPPYYMEPGS